MSTPVYKIKHQSSGQKPAAKLAAGSGRNIDNRASAKKTQQLVENIQKKKVRSTNPYASSVTFDGWELSAHHIIAHSKLVTALGLLPDPQRKELLVASIPDQLSVEVLKKLKVVLTAEEKENEAVSVEAIRLRLIDITDNQPVNGINIESIRESFYEWQSGNQYSGPNTSTRAEPKESKDAIDTDGQYFNVEIYPELKRLGDLLYDQLEVQKNASGQSEAETITKIYEILNEMIRLTKNAQAASFEADQWIEVSAVDELALLGELNRSHLENYTHFKLPISEISANHNSSGGLYDEIEYKSGDTFFNNKQIRGAQIKGTAMFIPYTLGEDSKSSLQEKALKKYLLDKAAPISSHLPKGLSVTNLLVEHRKEKESSDAKLKLEAKKKSVADSKIKAEKKMQTKAKEIKRLTTMKNLSVGQSKRLGLFRKQYEDARKQAILLNTTLTKLNAL